MKKIYFVLTYTGTVLSRIVRLYTKDEFSHVSISLDDKLEEMYSFGRVNPYTPIIAALVQESPKFGAFKRFYKTTCVIYSYEVTKQQYSKIKNTIYSMLNDGKKYRFNFIGLCGVSLKLKIKRKNKYYCAEYIKYLLDTAKIDTNLPELVKPCDFKKIDGITEIYRGLLNKYNVE